MVDTVAAEAATVVAVAAVVAVVAAAAEATDHVALAALAVHSIANCRIPDDCIDSNRYPLFMARAVLQELIESLQSISGVQPC